MRRVGAVLAKEMADLKKNPSVFVPAVIVGVSAIFLPFFVAVIVPTLAGERLSDSSDFEIALDLYRAMPGTRTLDPEAAIQAWIFQQFLVLLVLTPVAGGMAVAAYSVIGEKQARTLEPLLATPITTLELLTAKVLGAFLPSVALALGAFVVYVIGTVLFARPGVFSILLTGRSLSIVFALGPLASLAALQLAVCVSSRVNDARAAQQIGALIILPISGLLVAQVTGTVVLDGRIIALIAAVLVILNLGLMRLGIVLFARESILTRWK